MSGITEVFVALASDVERIKTALGNALKVGPIAEVDAQKGYRIDFGAGSDGQPMLSPWYPHPESGGSTSTWSPLTKGQVVGVMHPSGDMRQGVMFRGGFTDSNKPPSQDLKANVTEAFGVKLTMKDGKYIIEGDVEIHGKLLVKDSADFEGAYVKHNGHAIDKTHRHKDVTAGFALTGEPQ